MLIVGLVSTKAEQNEIRLIAHVWMVSQRSRYLATKTEQHACKKEHETVQQQL